MKLSDFGKQFLNNPCDVMGRRESGDYQNSAFCSLGNGSFSSESRLYNDICLFCFFVELLKREKEKEKKEFKKEKHPNY